MFVLGMGGGGGRGGEGTGVVAKDVTVCSILNILSSNVIRS